MPRQELSIESDCIRCRWIISGTPISTLLGSASRRVSTPQREFLRVREIGLLSEMAGAELEIRRLRAEVEGKAEDLGELQREAEEVDRERAGIMAEIQRYKTSSWVAPSPAGNET